jgi:hypothetical protein
MLSLSRQDRPLLRQRQLTSGNTTLDFMSGSTIKNAFLSDDTKSRTKF